MKRLFNHLHNRSSAPDDAVVCAPTIEGLIEQLADKDGIKRERARHALVAMGPRAVEPVLQALGHRKSRVRFEAAMCLRDIADRRAIDGLVKALADRTFEVRWIAAEGLIAVGRLCVPAVLHALMQGADSVWLRDGSRHVLSHFAGLDLHSDYHLEHHAAWVDFDLKDVLSPVVRALESSGAAAQAPVAAIRAMESFPSGVKPRDARHIIPH
ncbi:MAG: HEAT repeat domain-containing protein [Dehalococcoidia bacterium]|nr:HEAT repeat domain-containing protein [Dehalococcoidia bacterium]